MLGLCVESLWFGTIPSLISVNFLALCIRRMVGLYFVWIPCLPGSTYSYLWKYYQLGAWSGHTVVKLCQFTCILSSWLIHGIWYGVKGPTPELVKLDFCFYEPTISSTAIHYMACLPLSKCLYLPSSFPGTQNPGCSKNIPGNMTQVCHKPKCCRSHLSQNFIKMSWNFQTWAMSFKIKRFPRSKCFFVCSMYLTLFCLSYPVVI